MQTLDQALAALCRAKAVTADEALSRCGNPEEFKRALGTAAGPGLRTTQVQQG